MDVRHTRLDVLLDAALDAFGLCHPVPTSSWGPSSCPRRSSAGPSGSARSCAFAVRAPAGRGGAAVRSYIRLKNYSAETDEDIFQETVTTAFLSLEQGRYTPRPGIPFTAYVKGIARNKIRDARRRWQRIPSVPLEDVRFVLEAPPGIEPEYAYEQAQQRRLFYAGLEQLPGGQGRAGTPGCSGCDHAIALTTDLPGSGCRLKESFRGRF